MVEEINISPAVEALDDLQSKNGSGENDKFLMKERFEIDFSEHLTWLDNNSAKAYPVTDRIDSTRRLFALVCDNETSPRLSILPYLKSIDNPALMKLIEYGTIIYSPEKSHNMALIYEMPTGGKVFEDGVSHIDLQTSTEKFRKITLSLAGVVDVFKGLGITHRAIRPDKAHQALLEGKAAHQRQARDRHQSLRHRLPRDKHARPHRERPSGEPQKSAVFLGRAGQIRRLRNERKRIHSRQRRSARAELYEPERSKVHAVLAGVEYFVKTLLGFEVYQKLSLAHANLPSSY